MSQSTSAKRRHQPKRPADDVVSGSEEDGKVFDDASLTRADIPKIVEAVMNQFLNRGASDSKQEQEGGDDDPHLSKYILKGATPFTLRDSAAFKLEIALSMCL